jgi:predicted lipoprotein with Yx(FWY)xxD motif
MPSEEGTKVKRTVYALCLIGAIAIAIAIAIAGCGSGGGDSSASGASGGSPSGGSKQVSNPEDIPIAVISAKKAGDLGEVLVDSEGRTLYDFHKDKRSLYSAKDSACYGTCTEEWPPLLTGGEPGAEGKAIETKLSTLARKDGTLQVTYYGHPLYTYAGDKKPGEANGNDVKAFGGEWYALGPEGEEPKDQ